jgi:hypothetical protein
VTSRRWVLKNALKSIAGLAMRPASQGFADDSITHAIRLKPEPPVKVFDDFTGLGYEMSSVATPGLLSTRNHRYVQLVRGLGPRGVMRVGGIVSDYTRYEPYGTAVAQPKNTVITERSLREFGRFLSEVGWSAIWTLNFAQGSIEDAAVEARAVATALGPWLLAVEIGNEVENFDRGQHPFRPAPWTYEDYRKEYDEWHSAIVKAVPHLSFAAPDTASSVGWVERMARDSAHEVQILTTHYYRANQGRATAEELLKPDPGLLDVLTRLRVASRKSGIPWRMCETNSFSGGGRPGVSNTFIGALWTLDYMLLLAQYGCSGVNIETGVNQLGFISSYSPIQDDGKGTNFAGVPYYGMLAFAAARKGCSELLPIQIDMRGTNATAYVLGKDRDPQSVVVVNRDRMRGTQFSLGELGMRRAMVLRLVAPSPKSKTGITFAGSSVDGEGRWDAGASEPIHDGVLAVPAMSAAVVRAGN